LSRLLDVYEAVVSPSCNRLGLVDVSVDTYEPNADDTRWLLPGPGMIYLQVPSSVIETSLRLESWTSTPEKSSEQWSGQGEEKIDLPTAEIAVDTIDDLRETPLILPSPGIYRTRWLWVMNGERGPFYSPVKGHMGAVETPPGHRDELSGKDQYCLVQIWRETAKG
jgi:hypothetical protein